MKCDSCNDNEATVHYTEIEGTEKREIHLCESCYQQQKAAPVQKMVDFAEMLKGLLTTALKEEGVGPQAMCPACGITLAEFRAGGRFGCPEDYRVFRDTIIPLLEKIQIGPRHLGSVPSRAGEQLQRENELIRLRRDLERAVQREEYEQAALLRDRIRQMSGGQDAAR